MCQYISTSVASFSSPVSSPASIFAQTAHATALMLSVEPAVTVSQHPARPLATPSARPAAIRPSPLRLPAAAPPAPALPHNPSAMRPGCSNGTKSRRTAGGEGAAGPFRERPHRSDFLP